MSLLERDSVLVSTTENGDPIVDLPFTRVNNVEGIGRSPNTAYSVGNVVYTDSNLSVALKCTTAGTTSNTELDISGNNIGDTVTDGSVVWQVCNRTSDVTSVNGKTGDVVVDLPVGHMYWSVEPNVPAGRLPAMGATYNRALYADLWAWANSVGLVKSESEWQAIASANDGNCAYYSSGDGSTTFRVPKLPTTIASDVPSEVPVVGNGNALGFTDGTNQAYLSKYGNDGFWPTATSGNVGTSSPSGYSDFGNSKLVGITTDSSKSGIVAKTSATKITGMWLIVAYGVAHNIGEADVANVMQAVEQVQTGLGVTDNKIVGISDYIVESYRNGTEWYEVYKSGKVRQGGIATASSGYATVTFLKSMANTNYIPLISPDGNTGWASMEFCIPTKTTTTAKIGLKGYEYTPSKLHWIVEGQGA